MGSHSLNGALKSGVIWVKNSINISKRGSILKVKSKQAEELVKVMRNIPFPVTVMTTAAGDEQRGITIGSFTSLSMDPPLISFNLDRNSRAHDLFSDASHFVVHIPGPDEQELCRHFAQPDLSGDEQFEEYEYQPNAHGIPVLKGNSAVIHCKKFRQIAAGDHSIIIGEVLEIERNREEAAILYMDGKFRSL